MKDVLFSAYLQGLSAEGIKVELQALFNRRQLS